jgi:hypothetical protein
MPPGTFDPYAPPQHLGDGVSAGPLDARIEGGYLVLNKLGHIPDVCLKCAAQQGIVRREQTFSYTPPWVFAILIVCNIGGLIAMVMTMKRAKLKLPLCSTCNARWKSARTAVILTVLLLVSPLLLLFLPIDASNVGALALSTFAIAFVVLFVVLTVYVRPRVLQARKIDETTIKLGGVDPKAALFVASSARS